MIIYFVYFIILILHIIQYKIQISYFAEIFEFININNEINFVVTKYY